MQTLPMIIIVMSLEVTKPKKKIDHFLMIMIYVDHKCLYGYVFWCSH